MIVYSWIALGQSDPTARTETDPIARSGGDRTARSGSGQVADSGSGQAADSGSGQAAGSGSGQAAESGSGRTARSGSDRAAGSGSDRVARGGGRSDRAVWSGGDRMVLSHLGRTAPGGAPWATGAPVAMGITDDRGRAMKAGEETLRTGLAEVVIIEAVRPGMAAQTLAPCYVRTGVGWVGRPTPDGEVAWDRFFL